MRNLIKIIAYIISAITTIAYIISISAIVIPSEKSTIISTLGIGLPITFTLLIITAIFWLIMKKWIVATSIFTSIVLTYPIWCNTILIPINFSQENSKTDIKILSYNTQLFNGYKDFDQIFNLIKNEDPDILCLQEFGHINNPKNKAQNKEYVLDKFNQLYPYSHRWYKNQNSRSENGLVTFSKHPIVNKLKVNYKSKNNVSILSDIVINDDTIRLINNHLESNKISYKQKKQLQDDIISSTKGLSETLGKASNIRSQQAKTIREYIDQSPHPCIICGDFNDVPQSYVFHTIKGNNLNSAFTEAGPWGYYWTFHENLMYFPIDHILIDETFTITSAQVIKQKHSDHYPITATFSTK